MLFKLLSSAGTNFFYVGKKSARRATHKLTLKKFDPVINRHVLYVEEKLKSGRKK